MARSDILVIGGGIAGISAAARLAPHADVRVLEREDAPGYHATGRSAAIYVCNYGNAVLRQLNAASGPELEERGVLSPRGFMYVATPSEIAPFEAELAAAEGLEEISVAEACALFPLLEPRRLYRAAVERTACDVDVDRLLQGYLREARAAGATLETGAEVLAIRRDGDLWRVETAAGDFAAPILVNAAGAWADQIAQLAGAAPVGLTPYRRSAAILPLPDGIDLSQAPVAVAASETWYARPDAGRLMVSPADEDPVEPQDAYPDEMVLAEGLHRFEQAMTLTVTRVERRWAGLRTFAPDRTLVAGFDPDAPGFFWLAGQGGYGIQTSPIMARLSADLVLNRHSDLLTPETIAALSPERFA